MSPKEIAKLPDRLQTITSFTIRAKGLWLGSSFNTGRIYIPLYPEMRDGVDCIKLIQRRLGWTENNFYAIGFYNLIDHLNTLEAAELDSIISKYRNVILFEQEVCELSVIGTHNDLILENRFIASIPLPIYNV